MTSMVKTDLDPLLPSAIPFTPSCVPAIALNKHLFITHDKPCRDLNSRFTVQETGFERVSWLLYLVGPESKLLVEKREAAVT